MSLVNYDQLKTVTNVQITIIWYQIRMTSLERGTLAQVTHIRQSHLVQTFDGSHLSFMFKINTLIKEDYIDTL